MVTILCALFSIFEFRVRSRASLELELIALRHQVTVLRRQRPGRPQLSSLDRLLWVWLYRIWPQVIDAMVLVKPATVVQWHRKGFRLYWRWRSRRPGRPKISCPYRKSNPDVLMVQTTEVRVGHDAANGLNSTRRWCILVQR
jgi:putative transposase